MAERPVNLVEVVAFVIEVVAIGLLAAWGFGRDLPAVGRVLAGVVLAGGAVVLWGLFAAPRARHRRPLTEAVTKVAVLGGSILAARSVWPSWAWTTFAAVVVVDTVLLNLGPWSRPVGRMADG